MRELLLLLGTVLLTFVLCIGGAMALHALTGVWQWGLVGMLPGLAFFMVAFAGALDMGPWSWWR